MVPMGFLIILSPAVSTEDRVPYNQTREMYNNIQGVPKTHSFRHYSRVRLDFLDILNIFVKFPRDTNYMLVQLIQGNL